jgi:Protein of unknown function (DUF2785)
MVTAQIVVLSAALLAAAHPPEFWKAIAKAEFAPPAGADVPALALELCDLFASPDPELRDEVGYSTFASWVYQKKLLDSAALRPVMAALLKNLRADIGSIGTDAVFRRSFSALALSVVAARDNADAILDEASYRTLLDGALQYLDAEKDVRGYDPVKGWMHSAAHTADLIKFLARSRYIAIADQSRILDAVARKMTANGVFVYGEDERYARALLSIVNRKDFDRDGFAAWLLRAKPAPLKATLPAVSDLQGRQNAKNLFAKLEVLLSADAAPAESIAFARDRLRASLKDLF